MRKLFISNWLLLLSVIFIVMISYAAENISNTIPKWLYLAFSFIVLTLGRYVLSAIVGQRLFIDSQIVEANKVKYAVLRNKDYKNILEVKLFFELFENNDPDRRIDSHTLLRSENVALSSIAAVTGSSEEHIVFVALPEKIVELWQQKIGEKRNVFLKLGVTSVHYLTGYRDLKTQELVF